ncbi:hypothetical protein PsorP6_012373 [Peronosclerospora sorghi]|uniref:Uncharacterized protein n=1 Tax=Peronosclerospora sorghi TaxID=230839 RepID=A0ACC0WFT8_9STRA|nr:hypothetical protein PsorP6_012373 [Peronosclerospora sorghi]
MCHSLGKQVFKRHVEVFFDPLFFTLQGPHRRAIFAARECVAQLSAQIGPSIFRGRVDANTDVDGLLNARENLDDGAKKQVPEN